MAKETIVLSVGGSIIIPPTGFDQEFLRKFRELILEQVKKGKRFVLVIGGGATARAYQQGISGVSQLKPVDLDWLGIQTTILNAHFVRLMFGALAYPAVVTDPRRPVKTTKPIIVAAGWQPGCSTDKDAVLQAKAYGAKVLFNLSNIDYVYDCDPRTNPQAKKIEKTDWQFFRQQIVGTKWVPGKNVPFDPIASALAQKFKLKVGILRGTNLEAVKRAISGQPFPGTVVE